MKALVPLLVASLITLAFSLLSAGSSSPSAPAPERPGRAPLRIECRAPRTLHLRRFEDGSARLECGGRTLVRVSVPG
jgi:hypothetical protein